MQVSGLDLLGSLDALASQRAQIIDWVYSLQICHSDPAAPCDRLPMGDW